MFENRRHPVLCAEDFGKGGCIGIGEVGHVGALTSKYVGAEVFRVAIARRGELRLLVSAGDRPWIDPANVLAEVLIP